MRKAIIIFISVMFFLGCASHQLVQYRSTVKVENNAEENAIELLGSEGRIGNDYANTFYLFSAYYKETGQVAHSIVVNYRYRTRDLTLRQYSTAKFPDGSNLKYLPIKTSVENISPSVTRYYENFGFVLHDKMLSEFSSGFQINIFAKTGDEFSITITEEMISKQLEALKAVMDGYSKQE